MEKLLDSAVWVRKNFHKNSVTTNDVKHWVESGILPGKIINGQAFVYPKEAMKMMQNNTTLDSIKSPVATTLETDKPNKVAQLVQLCFEGFDQPKV